MDTQRAFAEIRAQAVELNKHDALRSAAVERGDRDIAHYIAETQAVYCQVQAGWSSLLKQQWIQERDRYRALARALETDHA